MICHSPTGSSNIVSRFIPNYSSQTANLHQLLPELVLFTWMQAQSASAQSIKKAIVNQSLAVFDPKAALSIITDASPYGLGAVLH